MYNGKHNVPLILHPNGTSSKYGQKAYVKLVYALPIELKETYTTEKIGCHSVTNLISIIIYLPHKAPHQRQRKIFLV